MLDSSKWSRERGRTGQGWTRPNLAHHPVAQKPVRTLPSRHLDFHGFASTVLRSKKLHFRSKPLKMPKVEIKVSRTHPALHGTPLGRVPPRLLSPLCSLYIEILYLFKKYFSWKTFNVFYCLTYVSRKAITVFPLVDDSLRSAPSSHLFEFPFWTKKVSVNWR